MRPAGAAGLGVDGGVSGGIVPVLAVVPGASLVPDVCGEVIGRCLVCPVPCLTLQLALSCGRVVQESSNLVAACDLPLRVAAPAVPGRIRILVCV